MERDYEKICNSLLFCIQTLTNEIDRLKDINDFLTKEDSIRQANADSDAKEYFELNDNFNSLQTKYDNALAMIEELTKSKPIVESKVTQEELNLSIDKEDKEQYLVDPNHFKKYPSRRNLTTEQAQDVYDSYVNKGKTLASLAKHFNVSQATIHQIINGISYKEINRNI